MVENKNRNNTRKNILEGLAGFAKDLGRNKSALAALTIGTLIDTYSSINLMNENIQFEGNPAFRFMAEQFGVEGGVILGKGIVYLSALYISRFFNDLGKKSIFYGLGAWQTYFGLNGIFALSIYNNVLN